VIGRSA